MTKYCTDDDIAALTRATEAQPAEALSRIDALLVSHPEDARLHFLRGSLLIGLGRLIEAHLALTRAVDLAPDFAIARFQLGFFQLTSGEAEGALGTWGRLDRLPDGHYLRKFVDGLRCLIRDDFPGAIANLREGIALNLENPPLNRDMQLLIEECAPLAAAKLDDADHAASETSLILRQFSGRMN